MKDCADCEKNGGYCDKHPKEKAELATAVLTLSVAERKAFGSYLIDSIKQRQSDLKDALKLAEKLIADGITSDEFGALYEYTQSDILFQLLNKAKGSKESRDNTLYLMVAKNRKKA